jgi:hypothetical protein
MHSKPILVLLTATLLLPGCRKPDPAPTPTPHIAAKPVTDSCLLLTPGEITSALGVPVGAGKHTLATSEVMCNWPRSGVKGEPELVLNFSSLAAFNREKSASGNVKITPAPGIGDEAFYVTSALGTSLLIRKGNTTIGFSIHDKKMAAAQVIPAEQTLGRQAAARL